MKLKAKINIYMAGMFILLLIILNLLIFFLFNRMMLDNEMDRSHAKILTTVKGINEANEDVNAGELLRAYLPIKGMFKVVDTDGTSTRTITAPELKHLKDLETTYYKAEKKAIKELDDGSYVFVSIPMVTKEGEVANLQLMESLEGTTHMLNILKVILIIVTLLAMVPVFLSSHILSKIISKPILSMIETMSDIQKSGKHKQIPLQKRSKDELYQMGATFNKMIEQLEKNYENQEQFIMNASHELKTPLTVIESYSDLLKRRGLEQPEIFEESIEAIHSEAIRMRELTEQLLLLTKKEAIWKMQLESTNIVKLLHDVIRYFHSAFDCEIELTIRENNNGFVDHQKLKQLLYIFIENACKYGGGTVQIEAGQLDDESGWIAISDDGIGIPAEDLDKIFERFYRVDKARTRKTGGFGLGLSLAKEIANVMNIKIEMQSEVGKGTTAKLIYPLANSN